MNPDPLAQHPEVRKWAEQFYAVKGWKKAGDVVVSGGAIDARRAAATLALNAVAIGPEFPADVRRAFDGGCKAIRNAIASAALPADFDPIDLQIQQLLADVAAQKLVAEARRLGRSALDAAQARLAAVQDRLDEGGYVHLQQKLNAAAEAYDKATAVPAFEAARKLAVDFLALADAGAVHGKAQDIWTAAALSFIAIEYSAGAETNVAEARRIAVRTAATAKSKTGDFAGATAELAAFPGDAKAAEFAKSREFNRVLAEFEAQHEAACAEVTGSELEGAKGHANDAKNARAAGLKNKKYDEGVAKIQDLTAWCLPRLDLARKLKSFDPAMNKLEAFRNAKATANAQQTAGKFAEALATLAALDADPDFVRENKSRVIDKRMGPRKDALKARVAQATKRLDAAWTAHADAVKANDFATAAVQAAKLEALFELEAIVDMKAEADTLMAPHVAAKAKYAYLADYRALGNAGDFAGARKAIEAALPLLRQLAIYLDTVAEAEAVRAALPAVPPELRGGIDAALATADVKALAKNPGAATAELRLLLDGPVYFGIAAAIADWKAKDAAVAKRHAQVLKFLAGMPATVKALADELVEARKPATDQAAYAESFLALARHEAKLAEVQELAATRRQVLAIRDGVLAAAKGNAAILDPAPKTEADLKAAVSAAEALALPASLAEAKAAFEKVRGDCEALSRKAALHCETVDGVGSNAGHSLDRHGPDVTLPDLIKRLQTGIPPNAKTPDERSYTGASSKFRAAQDWLAGRELAAEAARKDGIDLAATSLAKPFADKKTSAAYTVEHGRPIDEAFIGKKKHLKFDPAKNEFAPDKTYETFETLTGLTRAYVNWIWEFEVLKDVPVPDLPGPPKIQDVKARDIDEYTTNYEHKHGKQPDDIKGHWVMIQQFPVADGWDEALQSYTTDPKDLIP